jgi:hypothetical protein
MKMQSEPIPVDPLAPDAADAVLNETETELAKIFPVETAAPSAPPEKGDLEQEFMRDYRIGLKDMGFSPEEVLRRIKAEDREPTQLDEEILDGLMMGFYRREYELTKKYSFVLRTLSLQGMLNGDMAIEKIADGKAVNAFLFQAGQVARFLESFNGKPTCAFTMSDQDSFERQDALEARVKFVMRLPGPVVDAIGERLNGFVNRTSDAANRNLTNF